MPIQSKNLFKIFLEKKQTASEIKMYNLEVIYMFDKLIKQLVRLYWPYTVGAVLLFCFAALLKDEPLIGSEGCYIVMVGVILLVLAGVVATSWYLRTTIVRTAEKVADATNDHNEDNEDYCKKVGHAYMVRLIGLNVLSAVCSVAYWLTCIESCMYMVGILTLMLLISYPTRQLLLPHGSNE